LPGRLTGEIINGQLHTHPRPAWPHAFTALSLGDELVSPFQKGRGGPGGWWIVVEPEIHFVLDSEITVPDLAGWRREHMPNPPRGHKIEVVPTWVCEVLSPSTKSTDRELKMPLYARHGVSYAWLVDPNTRVLEAYKRTHDGWTPLGVFRDDDVVCAEPFDAISIHLTDLWG